MSKWVRGIYNTAANFNMSRSLRSASTWFMDRKREQLRQESEQSDKSDKSSVANQSCESVECGTPTDCLGCAPFSCARLDPNSNHYREPASDIRHSVTRVQYISRDENGNDVPITLAITAREQDGGISYTFSTEREGSGAWVRTGNESGAAKQTNTTTTDPVEHRTGIPTGVTI